MAGARIWPLPERSTSRSSKPSMTTSTGEAMVHGALVGALAGSFLAGMSAMMRQRDADANDLGVAVRHLPADPLLMEVISRYKPLAKHSAAMRATFQGVVTSADDMIRLCREGGGANAIRANRAMTLMVSLAKKLCRDALAVHKDESSGELMRDVAVIEGLSQQHLHNAMLET